MEDFIQAFFTTLHVLRGSTEYGFFFNFKSGPRLKEQT